MNELLGIYEAIPKVMASIGAIGKDRKNPQQGYSFRGIDDLYNAASEALIKHGVFSVPKMLDMKREERQTKSGGALTYTVLTMQYLFYASDGSSIEAVTVGEAMDSGDKSCNKAMSAAQKYAFLQVFAIPTEEPKDTENETHEVKPAKKAEPQIVKDAKEVMGGKVIAENGKTTNFKFLKAMKEQKERLGDTLYYKTLGANGYSHADEIVKDGDQAEIYKILKRMGI